MEENDVLENLKNQCEAAEDVGAPADAMQSTEALSEEEKALEITPEFLEMLLHREQRESDFVIKDLNASNDARAPWILMAHTLAIMTMDHMIRDMRHGYLKGVTSQALVAFPDILSAMLAWRPTTAIMGNDDEWETAKDMSKMVGQTFKFSEFDLPGTAITVTEVERNVRMPTLLRFNRDNRFAHRVDAVVYLDADSGTEIPSYVAHLSAIRFIEFPYVYQRPVMVYLDSHTLRPVRIEGSNGPEFDGYVVPHHIMEIIDADRKEHPERYPDMQDPDDPEMNDDQDGADIDESDEYFGMSESDLMGLVGGALGEAARRDLLDDEDEEDAPSKDDIRGILRSMEGDEDE